METKFKHGFNDYLKVYSTLESNIKSTVNELNKILYVGVYGIPVSPFIEPTGNSSHFISPTSYVPFVCVPNESHVLSFLELLFSFTDDHSNAFLLANECDSGFRDATPINSYADLFRHQSVGEISGGFAIYSLVMKMTPLDTMEELELGINLDKFDPLYKKAISVYKAVQNDWSSLGRQLSDFNDSKNYDTVDSEKREFLPFK